MNVIIKSIILICIVVVSSSQNLPISNCLSNCFSCDSINPSVCNSVSIPSINQSLCIPFFEGQSCSIRAGFQNILLEDGSNSKPFQNWSGIQPSQCIIANKSYNTLGILANATIQKVLSLPNRAIQVLVLKFIFVINDVRVSQTSNNNNTQVIEEELPDGTIIIRNISSGNSQNASTIFPFLNIQISSTVSTIFSTNFSYSKPSPVNSSCGMVYQYQILVPLTAQLNSVTISMSFIGNGSVGWSIVEARADIGCGSFLALGSCSSCLSGFYQVRQIVNNNLVECGLCPDSCKTCNSSSSCTTCQPYATIQPNNRCTYSSNFMQFSTFNITSGVLLTSQSKQVINLVRSKQGNLSLQTLLPSNQSYTVKFNILYSEDYQAGDPTIIAKITSSQGVNLQNANLGSLNRTIGVYITQINPNQKSYIARLGFNSQFTKYKDNKVSLSIISSLTTSQFYISNYNVYQFKCSNQCQECAFNSSNQCVKCYGFYDLTTNCISCANGFFLNRAADICIKCYSTCKQCSDSSSQGCTQCFDSFQLDRLIYNYPCISCLFATFKDITLLSNSTICNQDCAKNYNITLIIFDSNCNACFTLSNLSSINNSTQCQRCFIKIGLSKSQCVPSPSQGYTFYGNDVDGIIKYEDWVNNNSLTTFNCTSYYIGLYGVAKTNNSIPTKIKRVQQSLPPHSGLTMMMNIFKIDSWKTNPQINITISSGNQIITQSLNFSDSAGNNICGGDGNEMIFTYVNYISDHRSEGPFTIQINSNSDGIFVKNINIYLGNCPICSQSNLRFSIEYIPKYYIDNTQSGLDTWIKFNQNVQFTRDGIEKSLNFSIDKLSYSNLIPYSYTQNLLPRQIYYFLPINSSFVNGTLRANTTQGESIISSSARLLIIKNLNNFQSETIVDRFDIIDKQNSYSVSQIRRFFEFFSWFTLITMIVTAFFGIGVVFQQFSILLQLQFLHIYISSANLPANFKLSIETMQNMENLNFFASQHQQGIESTWIGSRTILSPHILEQYNTDVMFIRSFYPIIIINLIYLGWFVLLTILYRCVNSFRTSQSHIIKFLRDIPARPVNYIDQIWRYQFITTIWASFLQFFSFDNSNSFLRVNLAICIFSFVISLIWPMFVMGWTYYNNLNMVVHHFLYQYEDIFFRKIPSISDKDFKYYFYIAVRFSRYFIYAVFIAQFIDHSLVAPVILIVANLLELFYIIRLDIYRDMIYLTFKIIENLLFIVVQVLMLIMFGFSNQMSTDGYFNLGYAVSAIYVIMIVNGILRFIYISWKKTKHFILTKYDYGIQGQLVNYDNANHIPVQMTERIRE